MKKYLTKYFALLISASLILCLPGCGKEHKPLVTFRAYEDMSFQSDIETSGVICENEKWALHWDDKTKRVSFTDKETGAVWGQLPAEATKPVYQENGMIKKNHPQLESVLQVIYQDPKSFDDITAYSYSSSVQNDGVYAEKIENGIRVTYEFMETEFSVPVEYTVREDSFCISVDPTAISEGETYKVHSVALAPFLCGIENKAQDSWLFIPDGSGAVIEPVETDGVGIIGEKYVYGKDLSYQTYSREAPAQQIHMPVFGVKKGNTALLAVISSGAEAAAIHWNVGSSNIGYSTVYPEFRIRGFSHIQRPENFVTTTTLGAFKVFGEGIVTEPITVEYRSLSGDKSGIYGMAECYQSYLTEHAGLDKKSEDEKDVSFKYIGAVMQPSFFLGIPTSKLFPLTTTADALQMTQELSAAVGNDMNVNLIGFGKTGFDIGEVAGGFDVAGSLGGSKGMRELVKALDEQKIHSFMDFDLISFSKSGSGFGKDSTALYPGGQIVKYTSFDMVSNRSNQDRMFVLSRKNLFTAAQKVVGVGEKLGLSGVSYNSLSKKVYSDYAQQAYYISGKMPSDVSEIFKSAKESGYKVLSSAANDYAAIRADYVNDAPLYSSNYTVSAYDVPFYQLVFKGYRPMSSVSLNLCPDSQDALLRCVESGISPSYTLYYRFENELVTNEHSFLFGSVYSGNKDEIIETVGGIKDYLKSVEGAAISGYTRLSETASLTKFDNGVYTVVNFGNDDIETDYGKVAARSYITGRDFT